MMGEASSWKTCSSGSMTASVPRNARPSPRVKVHVLGPPNLTQSRAIETQVSEDPEEFWHLQAAAARRVTSGARAIFPRARKVSGSILPLETRWFLPRVESIRGEQLLEIVRILDKQMNNTSVILLFEVGGKKLLFPGDAQLENWMFALKDAKNAKATRKLLAGVDLYKVGHHGSLNATPKTLWRILTQADTAAPSAAFQTLLSTQAGVHGGKTGKPTEVPRGPLVQDLRHRSRLATTLDRTDFGQAQTVTF